MRVYRAGAQMALQRQAQRRQQLIRPQAGGFQIDKALGLDGAGGRLQRRRKQAPRHRLPGLSDGGDPRRSRRQHRWIF